MTVLMEDMEPVSIVNVMLVMNLMVQRVLTRMSVCIKLVGIESVSIQMGAINVNVMKDTVLLLMVLAKIQMNVKM